MISVAVEKVNHMSMISKSFIACGLTVNDADEQLPKKSVVYNFNHCFSKIFDSTRDWNHEFENFKHEKAHIIEAKISKYHVNQPPKKRKQKVNEATQ